MKLTEALKVLQRLPEGADPFSVLLACGFTPQHLQTFLAARLQQYLPTRQVKITTGLYGDMAGTLEYFKSCSPHAVAVALEWADLDPRLGFRGSGDWTHTSIANVLTVVRATLERFAKAIEAIPAAIPVAVSLPTLRLPPLFHTPGGQIAEEELSLEQMTLEFASHMVRRQGLALVNSHRLAEDSPPGSRFDLKSDLLTGLPYTLAHADAVALALARLLASPTAKKGLISDLDDTLWHGIVGEIGPENVSWDLASHHQLHGLYQRFLAALAEEGILVGIASKNDPAVVRQALDRPDLLLRPDLVFPVEAHWNAKSGSVDRILQRWNLGADSVVFVDDSPMELAEIAAAHPGIECVLFPKTDYAAANGMLRRLRDLFGKPRVSYEDTIRVQSIRQGAAFHSASGSSAPSETFLEQAGATVVFDFDLFSEDPRIVELVNKTNQFNLNGLQYTDADWKQQLSRPSAILASVNYRDRFGPLGKIAVVQGRQDVGFLWIETWVMSCRAFSRRIEHQCLKVLLDRYGAQEIIFEFRPTPKNTPLQDFLTAIAGHPPGSPFGLTRTQFEKNCPPLYHRVTELPINSRKWTTSQLA